MAVLTDTMGVDFNLYLARVLHDVRQNWYALMGPPTVTKKGKVVIEFFILKDGSVAGLKIVRSSGEVPLSARLSAASRGQIPSLRYRRSSVDPMSVCASVTSAIQRFPSRRML